MMFLVFVLPLAWTTGLAEPPLDLVSLDGSQTYWEVGKAIRQALRADPNTLEMLFAAPEVTENGEAPAAGPKRRRRRRSRPATPPESEAAA